MADDLITVVRGDITQLDVDVIVNAAHPSLLGGSGVDGAIHFAAGRGLFNEIYEKYGMEGCPRGEARITGGHNLKAKWIIHAVGPIHVNGKHGEAEILRSCYHNSMQLAHWACAESIAFPCISVGVHSYPRDEACEIAVNTVLEWLEWYRWPRVVFCCYEGIDEALYRKRLSFLPGMVHV